MAIKDGRTQQIFGGAQRVVMPAFSAQPLWDVSKFFKEKGVGGGEVENIQPLGSF